LTIIRKRCKIMLSSKRFSKVLKILEGGFFMKCKKLLAILTFTALIGSMLSGCGTSQKAAEPAQAPAATQAPADSSEVKLVYARGKDTTKASNQIIDEFNKKYQGKIHVDLIEMPSDTGKQHDQYVTVFSAKGTDYDVIDGDVIWPAEFAQAGYALPLDKLVQKDGINMNDYMQGPVQALTFKSQLWGMPKFIDAGVMFYRKDLLSAPPATWEDLYKQAEALKGKAKFGFVGQGKQYEGLVCNATEFIAAYGGAVVDGDGNITIKSDGTKAGLQEMKKIFTSDFVPKDITNFTEPETDNAFIAGDSAIARNWPYQWADAQDASKSKVVDKVGVAALPKGSVKAAAALGGWVTMINKYSKHPNEAWEFVKFMSGPEGQKITATVGGGAPTLLSVYNDPEVQKNPLFANKDFVNGLSAAVSRPVSPIYPKLSDIMQKEISKYLSGAEDVDTAIGNMDTQMKQAVQDAGK
jgi:multiple sugar transport system substrate-binding protein